MVARVFTNTLGADDDLVEKTLGDWLGLKFGVVSLAAGATALMRSVYQAGGVATDPGGVVRKRRIAPGEHCGQWILLPTDAPDWASDPGRLWSAAGRAERQWNAQEARILDVQIPRGFPETAIPDLVHAINGEYAEGGLAVQVDYHVSPARDGDPNPHLHGLISTRTLGENGFAPTKVAARHWNTIFRQDGGRAIRRKVAVAINSVAAKHGIDLRVNSEPNRMRGLPVPEPRLPRSVFRKPNTAYAREKLAEIDRHRVLRGKWNVASDNAHRADADAKATEYAIAMKRATMACVAPLTRIHTNPRLAEKCQSTAELAWIHGCNVASVEDHKGFVFINFVQAQIIVEPDKAFIDGRIDEEVGDFVGELAADLGWELVEVLAANREEQALLRRSVRRMSRSLDPRLFQIAALQGDPNVINALKSMALGAEEEAERRGENFLDDPSVSRSTQRVKKALLTGSDLDQGPSADFTAWDIFHARLEIDAVALSQQARRLKMPNQTRTDAPRI